MTLLDNTSWQKLQLFLVSVINQSGVFLLPSSGDFCWWLLAGKKSLNCGNISTVTKYFLRTLLSLRCWKQYTIMSCLNALNLLVHENIDKLTKPKQLGMDKNMLFENLVTTDNTIQYNTILTIQYYTIQYNTIQYNTIQLL